MTRNKNNVIVYIFFLAIFFNLLPSAARAEETEQTITANAKCDKLDCYPVFTNRQGENIISQPLIQIQLQDGTAITSNQIKSLFIETKDTKDKETKNPKLILTAKLDGNGAVIGPATLKKIRVEPNIIAWSLAITVITIGFLIWLIRGAFSNLKGGIFVGVDNRYSNSQTQFALWSGVIMFTYIAIFVERFLTSLTTNIPIPYEIGIPEQLWILMGINTGVLFGAKAIVSSKVDNKDIIKTEADHPTFSNFIANDSGVIDIGDTQMFTWSLVAIAIYLAAFYKSYVHFPYIDLSPDFALPVIDNALLSLSGVSVAAYIGKKFIEKDPKK